MESIQKNLLVIGLLALKNKKIIIMGANNPQTIRLIDDINSFGQDIKYEILGWIDNDTTKVGKTFFGYPVLGTPEILSKEIYRDVFLVNNITTDGMVREETTQQLLAYKLPFASLIHPSVNGKDVSFGSGILIHENVILEAGAIIDDYVAIASGAIVCHESRIGAYSFLSSGSVIAGMVDIGRCVTVFLGARIAPRLNIGTSAKISVGSVVVEDVASFALVGGNPARSIIIDKKQEAIACKNVVLELENLLKKNFPQLLGIKRDAYFADYELLKSFETLKLILELEKVFAITIRDEEVDECNLGSFDNLVVFIQSKSNKTEM